MSQGSTALTVREFFSTQRELYSQADADRIGPELLRLAGSGHLTAGAVVAAARPAESPLHPYFEWDDHRAAEGFRQLQAGRMVRTIKVRIVEVAGQVAEPKTVDIKVVPSMAIPPATVDSAASSVDSERAAPSTVQKMHSAPARLENDTTKYNPPATEPGRVRPAPRPPGMPVWRDRLDPAIDEGRREKLAAVPDDPLIGRAMARLLGFEDTYSGERSRASFEHVFGPVFEAITEARRRAGLDGAT